MMTNLFILIFFSVNLNNSQYSGVYNIDSVGNYSLFLEIDDNNRYSMSLIRQFSLDIYQKKCLTHGNIIIKENNLILKDVIQSFELVLKKEKEDYIVLKGFSFLKDKKICLFSKNYDEYEINSCFKQNKEDKNNIASQNNYFDNKKAKILPIKYGDYENNNLIKENLGEQGYNININSNGKYNYYINNIPLSSGNWKLQKNMLILEDIYLKHSFNLIIDNDSLLKSCFLVGIQQGELFKLKAP